MSEICQRCHEIMEGIHCLTIRQWCDFCGGSCAGHTEAYKIELKAAKERLRRELIYYPAIHPEPGKAA